MTRTLALTVVAMPCFAASLASAQVIEPPFDSVYTVRSLGTPEGVPVPFGGLFIFPGQPNLLYIGGGANTADGGLYRIGLVRDANGFATGFVGTAERLGDLPFNDGGITPDPGGLISAVGWPSNRYMQFDVSIGAVVNDIDLTPRGIARSSSCVTFIPPGLPGAGGMRIVSWGGGEYHRVSYDIGPGGIISLGDLNVIPESTLPGGPEGFTYVPTGSPLFTVPTMLVSAFSAGRVDVYDVDGSGDPIISTGRTLVSGLAGAEGATIDPVNGDFAFSTYGGGDRVVFVSGFVPPPEPCAWQIANCPADSDGDIDTDSDDVVVFFGFWEASDDCADVNSDGVVDSNDLTYFFGGWDEGRCRP